jgi:hypothetical protein
MNITANLPEIQETKINKLYYGFKNTVVFIKNIIHITKKVFML